LFIISAVVFVSGGTIGLSRLRPAPPVVDRGTIWTDEAKRGTLKVDVHGLGTLVPENIRWIPAQTDARVDRILMFPGAIVHPGSLILELSNPELKRDVLDAEYQLKASQADYDNLSVQLSNDLLNQKATAATVRSEYEQAKIQNEVDERLRSEGLGTDITAKLSKVKMEQLAIRLRLEEERIDNAALSAKARLLAQQAHVDQQRALYDLKRSERDALEVRAGVEGVLQLVSVDVGQHVTPGTNLARIANPKRLKALIKIAETQAKDIIIGQKAFVDTKDGIADGQVSRIDPSVKDGAVAVDVEFTSPLPHGARPDLSVEGTIEIENLKDVLYVGRPVRSQSESTIRVFKILAGDEEAVHVNVKLGKGSVKDIEILGGLKEGDKIILSDTSQWDAYDRIRLH